MKRLNNKTVEGEDCQISVPDIHHIVYSCSKYIADIEIEGGATDGQVDWLVYANTLKARDESDYALVNGNKEEILARISRALTLLGMTHSVA